MKPSIKSVNFQFFHYFFKADEKNSVNNVKKDQLEVISLEKEKNAAKTHKFELQWNKKINYRNIWAFLF